LIDRNDHVSMGLARSVAWLGSVDDAPEGVTNLRGHSSGDGSNRARKKLAARALCNAPNRSRRSPERIRLSAGLEAPTQTLLRTAVPCDAFPAPGICRSRATDSRRVEVLPGLSDALAMMTHMHTFDGGAGSVRHGFDQMSRRRALGFEPLERSISDGDEGL
jgi:hypothetical protein